MGMFDSFYFAKGFLKDDKAPEGHEFQTKELDSLCDYYFVDAEGNIAVKSFMLGTDSDAEQYTNLDKQPINATVYIYSHEFMYSDGDGKNIFTRKYLGCKYQKYKLIIENNKVIHHEKVSEEGYDDK